MNRFDTAHSDMCAADGCPLLGAITGSTQGDNRWLCHLHHGQPAARWARICDALEKERWLAASMVALHRARFGDELAEAVRKAKRTFAQQGRSDLAHAPGEAFNGWMRRLDAALTAAVLGSLNMGRTAPGAQAFADTWKRLHDDVPETEEEMA